jgi:hypothetical protein
MIVAVGHRIQRNRLLVFSKATEPTFGGTRPRSPPIFPQAIPRGRTPRQGVASGQFQIEPTGIRLPVQVAAENPPNLAVIAYADKWRQNRQKGWAADALLAPAIGHVPGSYCPSCVCGENFVYDLPLQNWAGVFFV